VLAATTLVFACTGDEDVADANNGSFGFNNSPTNNTTANNTAGANNTSGQNDTTANNTTDPGDMPPDCCRVDPDMAPDMPPAPDMDPPGPPTLEQQLIATDWVGFFELEEAIGTTSVGVAIEIGFLDDGSVEVRSEDTQAGKWQVVASVGDILLFDLPDGDDRDMDPDRLFLAPLTNDDGLVTALELNVGGDVSIFFEPAASNQPRISLDDVQGRWQSVDTLGENRPGMQRQVWLGINVTETGELEYGFVQGTTFTSFAIYGAKTITFSDGRTFWYLDPPTTDELPPIGGQILARPNGDVRLFAPYFDESVEPNDVYSIEMQSVERFGPQRR